MSGESVSIWQVDCMLLKKLLGRSSDDVNRTSTNFNWNDN